MLSWYQCRIAGQSVTIRIRTTCAFSCMGDAGTAGAYDANAPAAAVSAVPAANGTHVEAPQDDLMHDTTENEVVPGADDFATADGFMRHVHSLRRLIFSPLPGGVGVRGVPGSTSTANLTLQGDAAGDSADGAPASTGASVGGGLPTVTIEVLKNAAYEDVVRALANKLGQYVLSATYIHV